MLQSGETETSEADSGRQFDSVVALRETDVEGLMTDSMASRSADLTTCLPSLFDLR